MVGARLPATLVRDLKTIETLEQADRSATVRRLLARAIQDWKLEYFGRAYGRGEMTLAKAAGAAGVTLWRMSGYVSSNKIAAQYDAEDLAHDLARLTPRR
jgi:predicted HTH domain antitoxin